MTFSAIIVAAGSGRRMGFDKLMAPLCGKPVLRHSIDAFLKVENLDCLILVTDVTRYEATTCDIQDDRLRRADGGNERHDSVAAGLALVPPTSRLIAVHDGARPLIQPQQIRRCLQIAEQSGAASSAHRITDTLKRSDDQQRATSSINREMLWAMETPQIFEHGLLKTAYRKIINENALVTDEVSAVEKSGISTHLVENTYPNPKITFPQDLPLAEHLAKFKP